MNQHIDAVCRQVNSLHTQFCQEQGAALGALASRLAALFTEGGQLLVAGHGPMVSVAQMLAAQFTYKLDFDRPALPALCLGSDPLLATQMLSGGQSDQLLLRHYRAINSSEHLLLVFSDGSLAPELSALIEDVKDNDQPVFMLSGNSTTDPLLQENLDAALDLGSGSAPRLIEIAQFAGHLLCELVEKELFGR
jgi:phosphoheptose isomerase